MLTNKKIEDRITDELKPDRPFDEFCAAHGVECGHAVCVRKRTSQYKKVVIPVSAVAAVALCVGLPFAFMNRNDVAEPEVYGEENVSYNLIDEGTLLSDEKAYMFDLNKIEEYSNIQHIYATAKKSLTLAYRVTDIVYGYEYRDELYAYNFDYILRCYDNYYFTNIDMYSKNSMFTHNGIDFFYKIDGNGTDTTAYISFEKGDYDYFIGLRGYENMIEINDENVEIFIQNIFDA